MSSECACFCFLFTGSCLLYSSRNFRCFVWLEPLRFYFRSPIWVWLNWRGVANWKWLCFPVCIVWRTKACLLWPTAARTWTWSSWMVVSMSPELLSVILWSVAQFCTAFRCCLLLLLLFLEARLTKSEKSWALNLDISVVCNFPALSQHLTKWFSG